MQSYLDRNAASTEARKRRQTMVMVQRLQMEKSETNTRYLKLVAAIDRRIGFYIHSLRNECIAGLQGMTNLVLQQQRDHLERSRSMHREHIDEIARTKSNYETVIADLTAKLHSLINNVGCRSSFSSLSENTARSSSTTEPDKTAVILSSESQLSLTVL